MVCSCGASAFSIGLCNSCAQKSTLIERYPDIQTILTAEQLGKLNIRQSLSDRTLIDVTCQKCHNPFAIQIISFLKRIRGNRSRGSSYSYICHPCSKAGDSGISINTIQQVIDVDATVEKFGGIPKNVKKGKVVAICEDCKQSFDVKLSSILHQARRHKSNNRDCIYKCFDCGVKRPDALAASLAAREKQLLSGFRSNLEVAMANRLDAMGIKYQQQYPLGMYVWDFFLPDHNALVEVNGEYWHSLPENIAKDKAKLTYTNRYHSDYKTIVIDEKYFLNPLAVDKRLGLELGIYSQPSQIDFEFERLRIESIQSSSNGIYVSFLDSFHYAGDGRHGKIIYGAYLDDVLIAVCKFSSVVRKEVASSLSLKCHEVLELDRFCVHPSYQKKNLASWFLSRCINQIFKSNPNILGLATFADETFGHSGTIYKATNWTMIGKTKSSYHYLGPNGIPINKKRVYDIASKLLMKESEYAQKHGLEKYPEQPKTKFVFRRP